MVQFEDRPIVVAIDGTQEGLRALDYAVDEAERNGCSLDLVHVVRAHPQLMSVVVAAEAETEMDLGSAALSAARERVLDRTTGIAVTQRLLKGSLRHELPHAAAGSRLLVLGRTPLTGIERLAAGSVGIPVIARATVPVVSVPCTWTGSDGGAIVAAVSDESSAMLVLRAAFEEARATGVGVIAIRAVDRPATWADDLPVPEYAGDLLKDAERAFSAELARWTGEFPDVDVEMKVTMTSPIHALLPAAGKAQLVVAASRRRGELLHPRLGSTARALLVHAPCPVLIVPAERPHLPPRLSLRAGVAQPGDAVAPSY
ncbi:MAG: universal stress protein [Nocardioidaceae bacterium]